MRRKQLPNAESWRCTWDSQNRHHGSNFDQREHIRIEFVEEFPLPPKQPLRDAAVKAGLFGPQMAGITFGHSLLIRRGRGSVRLFPHEFRHVQQYEQYGSIGAFLQEYLHQIAAVGYDKAPLELDAQDHELTEV